LEKPLKTLIKISKGELDAKRQELAAFLNKKERKILDIKKLNDDLEAERDNLPQNPEAVRVFDIFILSTRNKQARIIQDIEQLLDPEIGRLTDEIAEKFSEMKKYEIMLERRLEEARKELNKKTQSELDEIALTQFNLKNSEDQ
jgi:flagellar FliJ protein